MPKKEIPTMIVASKLKEFAKPHKVNISGDFIPALNDVVANVVNDAVRRCQGNGRKTLRPDDL